MIWRISRRFRSSIRPLSAMGVGFRLGLRCRERLRVYGSMVPWRSAIYTFSSSPHPGHEAIGNLLRVVAIGLDFVEQMLLCWFSVKMTARLDVNATPGVRDVPSRPGDRTRVLGRVKGKARYARRLRRPGLPLRSLVLIGCGREGTEWGSWDQSVHAGTLLLRRSRRASRACSSFRSRSDQISGALPAMKSSGAM